MSKTTKGIMEYEPTAYEPTAQEQKERAYKEHMRDLTIGRTRGALVRMQLLSAYDILENIRFDYISDTAFREKVVGAKREIERAMCDFLLDDAYWERKLQAHNALSNDEYWDICHDDGTFPVG